VALSRSAAGDNARAALMTAVAEMMRLGVALGGERQTLMGLSGLGDLALTATAFSRATCRWHALAKAGRLPIAGVNAINRGGVPSAPLTQTGRAIDVDMPIASAVNDPSSRRRYYANDRNPARATIQMEG